MKAPSRGKAFSPEKARCPITGIAKAETPKSKALPAAVVQPHPGVILSIEKPAEAKKGAVLQKPKQEKEGLLPIVKEDNVEIPKAVLPIKERKSRWRRRRSRQKPWSRCCPP